MKLFGSKKERIEEPICKVGDYLIGREILEMRQTAYGPQGTNVKSIKGVIEHLNFDGKSRIHPTTIKIKGEWYIVGFQLGGLLIDKIIPAHKL